jgi:hypothetical protein
MVLYFGFTIFFVLYVWPLITVLISQGDWWVLWPTLGVLGGTGGLLVYYFLQKALHYKNMRTEWRNIFIIVPILFASGTGLAYVFDMILPVELEPYRTIILPSLIFTIVLVTIAKRINPKQINRSH